MDKYQIRSTLIVLLALILIVGGIYYSKKTGNKDLPSGENVAEPTVDDNEVSLGEDSQSTPNIAEQNTAAVVSADLNTARFNEAIKSAQVAFGKGNYKTAISKYNLAHSYRTASDLPYSGLFNVYTAQNEWIKAETSLNKAMQLNPSHTDYWTSKLSLMDDKTNAAFTDLNNVYEEGLTKVDSRTKVNLVTHFAVIAEKNTEYKKAIMLWEYAKTVYPANLAIYQAEIDRLKSL